MTYASWCLDYTLNKIQWIDRNECNQTTRVVFWNGRQLHIRFTQATWARFLYRSQNVLSSCLSQDHSETFLRSLAISVFHLCLSKKIFLQIRIQVRLKNLTLINIKIFCKLPCFNNILYSNDVNSYWHIIAMQMNALFVLICLIQNSQIYLL